MRRNFTNLFGFVGLMARLFNFIRGKNASAKGTAFTKEKVAMGKGMYRPLHEVVSMNGAAPIPARMLMRQSNSMFNQKKQRKYARQMGRKVA